MARKRKPNGYYTLENTIYETKKIKEEHEFDTLLSAKKLNELGYGGLGAAIGKFHGGLPNFREILGEKESRKPPKYWQSLENTIYESKKIMEEHNLDTLPSQTKFHELGYSSLNNAIRRYHSGFPNFREIMNQELGIKSNKEHLTESQGYISRNLI